MPRKPQVEPENTDVEEFDVSTEPAGIEWENVAERSAITILFDKFGDTFIGQFAGTEFIEPENGAEDGSDNFTRFVFTRDGQRFAINLSYKVAKAMTGIAEGKWVRIKYVADIPTKRGLNPMKDFVVDVQK